MERRSERNEERSSFICYHLCRNVRCLKGHLMATRDHRIIDFGGFSSPSHRLRQESLYHSSQVQSFLENFQQWSKHSSGRQAVLLINCSHCQDLSYELPPDTSCPAIWCFGE